MMKEKEMYLADLRSLKENISNKIMEAIQDLEAKNLKKIEKKIEKASQKIAMGLIKASLKNAELLTRKISNVIGPVNSSRNLNSIAGKKRGRPSVKLFGEELPGFESTTLKTILASKSIGTKRRGRPSKLNSIIQPNSQPKTLKGKSGETLITKKRGRPFGIKSILNIASPEVVAKQDSGIKKESRGRPKNKIESVTSPLEVVTNNRKRNTVKDTKHRTSIKENQALPEKRRGRPRIIQNTSHDKVSNILKEIPKGRRGRPSKIKLDSKSSSLESAITVPSISRKPSRTPSGKKLMAPNQSEGINYSIPILKKRGRKPKIQDKNAISMSGKSSLGLVTDKKAEE